MMYIFKTLDHLYSTVPQYSQFVYKLLNVTNYKICINIFSSAFAEACAGSFVGDIPGIFHLILSYNYILTEL